MHKTTQALMIALLLSIVAIVMLILIPVSCADEYDGQPTWQERNEQYIQEDQARAMQRSVELQEQQQLTHAAERENDYQRSLQQRQDPTDYRSLGQY
ncbi:MAG: hypothetical protein LUQ26_05290 [Methylococcaceae bacterium]|nr:hypothetical protein [Methylococcaceae bacterium]